MDPMSRELTHAVLPGSGASTPFWGEPAAPTRTSVIFRIRSLPTERLSPSARFGVRPLAWRCSRTAAGRELPTRQSLGEGCEETLALWEGPP